MNVACCKHNIGSAAKIKAPLSDSIALLFELGGMDNLSIISFLKKILIAVDSLRSVTFDSENMISDQNLSSVKSLLRGD